jgi:hypothetical protein
MRKLPIFQGFTVDFKLRELRKKKLDELPEFISFESVLGELLLNAFRKQITMKLLSQEILEQLPPLYSQEEVKDPMIVCKFFYPDFGWTWYAIEFDGKDTFYGLVDGDERELGYFSLTELMDTKGPFGLQIERDMYFKQCKLSEIMK